MSLGDPGSSSYWEEELGVGTRIPHAGAAHPTASCATMSGRRPGRARVRLRGERHGGSVGKVAVVTGGAAGIGRGIVGALLDEGCRVVIADIEGPVLTETVAELSERGDVRESCAMSPILRRSRSSPTRSTASTGCAMCCGTTPA